MTNRVILLLVALTAVVSHPPARAQSFTAPHASLTVTLAATTSIGAIDTTATVPIEASGIRSDNEPDARRGGPDRRAPPRRVERDRTSSATVQIPSPGIARTDWHPELSLTFDGISHRDQRFADGGQTFTIEPPDQGLCVGNGFVLETVNRALRVYDTTGAPLTPAISLNSFYGYPPARAINGDLGPSIADPSCYFDRDTRRWFHLVNTADRVGFSFEFAGNNHLDLAVSQTSNPLDGWNIYRIAAQNNGTEGTPNHDCPSGFCLADFPHFGADANGIYITTNEFGFFQGGFQAAQIYAVSKRALAAGDAMLSLTLIDTRDYLLDGHPGFTVLPAATPSGRYATGDGGTEYFLSSVEVFSTTSVDNRLRIWALTNTQSLNTPNPSLVLTHGVVAVEPYADAPFLTQKKGDVPLADCLNDRKLGTPFGTGCWRFVVPTEPLDKERENQSINSGPTHTTQVTFEDGKLWTAICTAIAFENSKTRAGLAYFVLNPSLSNGIVHASVINQGYVGDEDAHLAFPAIGVTAASRAVIAFSLMGREDYPSAGYVTLDPTMGVGDIHIVAAGLGPEDGLSAYNATNPGGGGIARWGDYGAATVDGDSIWIGSEYIGQTCTFDEFVASGFNCGGTRVGGANWYTRISKITPW